MNKIWNLEEHCEPSFRFEHKFLVVGDFENIIVLEEMFKMILY